MSDVITDAFFAPSEEDIPFLERDRYGRPLIIQPDGSKVAYTRASTMGGIIEDKTGLHKWDVRNIVRGVGVAEHVAGMAAALPSLTGDKHKDALTNAALDEYADMAREVAGEHLKANWGTAVHGFTEPGMENNPAVPARMQPDVDSYWAWMNRCRVANLASEVFVVNDELRVAGTFDDLYYCYGYGLVVGDKKTGKAKMLATAIQMAIYANSVVYDPETGRRTPLAEYVAEQMVRLYGKAYPVNLKAALFVHIPAGEGRTEIIELNIEVGYELARHAAAIRDARSAFGQRALARVVTDEMAAHADVDAAYALLRDATTSEEMSAIYQQYRHVWTEQMTAFGRRQLGR